MSDINTDYAKYVKLETDIEALEVQLAGARKQKSDAAQYIKDTYGSGPHTIEGKTVIVAQARNGTHFLRAPLPGRKKKTTDAAA